MDEKTNLPRDLSHLEPTDSRQKWLTKDRFWNLVFAFSMTAGLTASFAIVGEPSNAKPFPYSASFIMWFTLIAVPLIVRHFSKTQFVKGNTFLNSEGKKIDSNKDTPNGLAIIATTMALTGLTGMILDNLKSSPLWLDAMVISSVIFFVPTVFFIVKNCPISILFNRKLYKFEANTKYRKSSDHAFKASRTRSDDYLYNPGYSGLDANIHHRTYHRR